MISSSSLARPAPLQKRTSLSVLLLVGTASLAVLLLDVYADWYTQGDPLWTTVLENTVPALLALTVVIVGWRLFSRHWAPIYLSEATKYALVGCVGMIAFSGLIIGLHIIQREIKPVMMVLQLSTVGAVAGLWVGHNLARVRQAEQKTEEERDRLANLIDGLPAPVVHGRFTGDELTILRCNTAFADVFAEEDEEIEGRNLYEMIVPETHRALAPDVDRQALQEGVVDIESRCLTTDGPRDFQIRVAQALDDGASETYSIYTDISEQKERERALKQTREQIELALEHTNSLIFGIDLETMTVWRRGPFADFFDVDPEAVATMESFLNQAIHPADRKEFQAFYQELIEGEKTSGEIEYRTNPKHGPIRWIRDNVHIDDGASPQILGLAQEVTERKKREEELIQAKEEAEEANRLKSAMLANMSHELRTPLTSITGFSELLANRLEGNLHRFANQIHKGSRRLQDTLEAVLHLSRLEAGVVRLERKPVRLKSIVENVLTEVTPQAKDKAITINRDLPTESVQGRWDESAFYRICWNLVENAIKFTPENGHIDVRLTVDEAEVHLAVEDSGIGMEPEKVPELFKAFKQESEGLDREYGGSGVGLSLVKRLTEALDGRIDVETKKDVGSCFIVHLPRETPTDAR